MTKLSSFSALGAAAGLLLLACDGKPTTPTSAGLDGPAREAGGPLAAARGRVLFHGTLNGLFADVSFASADFSTIGSLQIFQSGSRAILFYDIAQCDEFFNCTSVEAGLGPVPGSDLQGNAQALHLSTNTSAAANPEFTLLAGSGGVITVAWQKIDAFSRRFTGHIQEQFGGGFTIRSHVSETVSSAAVEGSVLGHALPPEGGFLGARIGTVHSGEIDILDKPSE